MTQRSGEVSVKTLLLVLAAAAVLTGLLRAVLSGSGGASSKTHVTFWNGFTGPDGIVMLDIIKRFNDENPDVEVTMQRIPWATYYNKLTVAGGDGRGPSIFVCHADALPRIRRAGFTDTMDDVFSGDAPIDPNDFDGYVLDRIKFKGHFNGVPLDIHPQGMFCDADMLKEAGIVDAQGQPRAPANGAEFEAAIDATTKERGAGREDKQWGFALTAWGNNVRSLMAQFDGHYLDQNGNADLDNPENLAALTYISDLARKNKVPPPSNGLGWLGYRQKKVAMVWDGVYMLGDLMRVQAFNYIGGMIPTIGKHPGTVANSHVLCVRKGLSAKEREGSIRFIKFLSKNSLDWAAAGQIPARVSLRKTSRFESMQVQHAFADQIPYMQYPPKTPVIFEFILAHDLACERAVRGTQTPKEALAQANKEAQAAIDRDRKDFPEDYQP